jgi:diketogulonate reductase-like aldo/keto reductase
VIDRTNQINLADAAVVVFTNILTGVTLLDTAFMVSNRDEAVETVIKGEKTHRKSSKG